MVANPQRNDWHGNMNPQHDNTHENDIEDIHGIPMTEEAFEHVISVESPYRYELIDGMIYDMTNATPEHTDLTFNVTALFKEQLGKRGPCRAYHDQSVFIPNHPSVTPDVVVTCDVADRDKNKRLKPFKVRSPLIIVEVLSPSTERFDRTEKFARYKCCPTLEVYILVNQYKPHVEVYQRTRDWQPEYYNAGQVVQFDQLDLELPLDSIYEGVL
jgi:Uma2 family endonuclease